MEKYKFNLERALAGDSLIAEDGEIIMGFRRDEKSLNVLYPYIADNGSKYTPLGKWIRDTVTMHDLYMKYPSFKEGDKVLVKNTHNEQYVCRYFHSFDSKGNMLCTSTVGSAAYKLGNPYSVYSWKYYKYVPQQHYKATIKLNLDVSAKSREEAHDKIKQKFHDIKDVVFIEAAF